MVKPNTQPDRSRQVIIKRTKLKPHEGTQNSINEKGRLNKNTSESPEPDKNQINSRLDHLHSLAKRDLPFIYQRDKVKSCTNAASTSIISGGKAVDFAAFAAGILTLVINVNNNINNNNNNNNNLNINAVDSSNIVANLNTNNANQVKKMAKSLQRAVLSYLRAGNHC